MSAKRQCAGVIVNPKSPSLGEPCSRWAVNGSDMCAVHGGSDKLGLLSPQDLKNRCVAHSTRSGDRCKKPAINGGTVCTTHGGSAGHVKKKARELMDRMVEPGLHQLREIMLKPGTSDSDRLRAVQMMLDRSGFGPGVYVEHEVRPWEAMMPTLFKQTNVVVIRDLPDDMRAAMESAPDYTVSMEDIEDAEVVEDDRDRLERLGIPRIVPPFGPNDKATIRGSSHPPKRDR
ncbi:hypothetical protein ABIB56_001861 [Glaciihabitans sp. UYNi722]